MLSRMPGKLFTEQEIVLLWRCYKEGQSNPAIGQVLGREHSIVSGVIRRAGGPAGRQGGTHRSPQSCTYFDLRRARGDLPGPIRLELHSHHCEVTSPCPLDYQSRGET
jgi:hypothetical protein